MSRFNLTFSGAVQPGKDPAQVRSRFARLFGIDDRARLERFFSGEPVILRRNLERREAAEWFRKLSELGASAELVLVDEEPAPHEEPEASRPAETATAEPVPAPDANQGAPSQPDQDRAFQEASQRAQQRAARKLQREIAPRLGDSREPIETAPAVEDSETPPEPTAGRDPNLFAMQPFRNTARVRERANLAQRSCRRAAALAAIAALLTILVVAWQMHQPPPAPPPGPG